MLIQETKTMKAMEPSKENRFAMKMVIQIPLRAHIQVPANKINRKLMISYYQQFMHQRQYFQRHLQTK